MLEPFVARIRWQTHSPERGERWEDVLRDFVAGIASEARRSGARLIGHIKGIAAAEEQFLRINCVSERIAPDVDGALPSDAREIALDLAVLVYGLSHEQVGVAVEAALAQSLAGGRCTAALEALGGGRAQGERAHA